MLKWGIIGFLLLTGLSVNAKDKCFVTVKLKAKKHKGHFAVALFSSERGFPGKQDKTIRKSYWPASKRQQVTFENLACGEYAVAVIQDLNANKKLDKNFFGLPKEPFGFSQNPTIFFGAPSFKRAAFSVTNEKEIVIDLKGN